MSQVPSSPGPATADSSIAPITADRPPVLLVHGTGSTFAHNWSASGWPELLADAGRAVIATHLPGHGPDSFPEGEPAGAVLGAFAGTVDAVGFSAGAQAVLGAAVREPRRFRRLVLMGMGDRMAGLDTSDQDSASTSIALAAAVETGADQSDRTGLVLRRLVLSAGNDPGLIGRFLRTAHPAPSPEQLRNLTMPILVVLGSEDFARPADRLLETLPNARKADIRGADHFSTPSDFGTLDAVMSFLDAS